MTRDETRDFIKKVIEIYPSWRTNNIDELSKRVDTWHEFLEKEDALHINKALTEYVEMERNKFAPSVSDMLFLAKKYRPDPRFEGVDYWENKTRGIYPYPWRMDVYRTWYTNDREAGRFHRYLQKGIQAVEEGRVDEEELRDLKYVIKVYEEKKCSMMKKD